MNAYTLTISMMASLSLLGCSAKNETNNQPQKIYTNQTPYSASSFDNTQDEVTVILSFSGGGTRAAALSYGVLEGLRDTTITIDGKYVNLLDEVDVISSVSGGSFTAAYYGLYGERTFEDYKEAFLYHEVTDDLASIFLSPVRWFSSKTRTREATDYYKSHIFGETTYADLPRDNAPYIVINATDISTGTRFSFTQDYFDMLCSDLNSFSVSSAVAASSAVPLLFTPVVLRNHDECLTELESVYDRSNYRKRNAVAAIEQYKDKEHTKYIHLVDGGITDNLGLIAIYELIAHMRLNDSKKLELRNDRGVLKPLVVISVDAATNPELGIAESVDPPSLKQTVDSITDIQLHRYNDSTKDLIVKEMDDWASEALSNGDVVSPYFVEVSFSKTMDSDTQFLLNQIRTDFNLANEDVDLLIDEGYQQLHVDKTFQNFLNSYSYNSMDLTDSDKDVK
ncbi:lipoprotein [Vibrio inusitatus NBRC 102082]|uniref:Lipoprotein n=1 Tax=Vibrio inusitatus NBRC 102082 TaxID=1219070 RepID=A0A4Y3HWY5_9VIBR|nr:patatin-like phospholipase family protein [Vibrio inusitatus]GEA50784.1 lipoprotein [Vibrio inusitatus NBRC 102082]